MKKIKYGFYILLVAVLLFGAARLYYRLTDDFRIGNMTYTLPFEAPWQVPTLTSEEHQELANILNQKFTYIGKGAQCYAFASDDQKYVLKFFKFKHLKPNFFIGYLPAISPLKEYKQSYFDRKNRKLTSVYNGYDIAYKENRNESALIYLHLLPTHDLKLQGTVIDKLGWERKINLDEVVFLLQKKGETLRTRLNRLLQQGKVQEAKDSFSGILNMYVSEYKKGIFDHDHGVMHNTGFIQDQPFHLDVGKLKKVEEMRDVNVYKNDLKHVIWKMRVWIKSSYPQYDDEFSDFLDKEYFDKTGEELRIKSIDLKFYKKKK